MSYCVNCGVKLAASEEKCPLCNTIVINPNDTGDAKKEAAYSHRFEEYPGRTINVKYLVQIILAIVGIGVLVQTLCDFLISFSISWSLYGIGAFALLVCFVLPVLVKFKSPYIATMIDLVAIALYIFMIAVMTDGEIWYYEFFLPLHILSSIYVWCMVIFLRKKRRNYFRAGGISLLFVCFLLILIEFLLDIFIVGKVYLIWSLCCAPLLLAIAILLLVIAANPKLREEMGRRLYMNY
ncbi:MAG: hypothetical protein IJD31_05830 [Lachnospiraceae bacterium]|nr:hypothetical protein [Lachnospiraceae bacterium]